MPHSSSPTDSALGRLALTHLRSGWLGLLVFGLLGIALEALHAFKSAAYLGVGQETRRLMWTLAHAHGLGLSLVHIAFAVTLRSWITTRGVRVAVASRSLSWAAVLIPGGFLLGGIYPYDGDPGLGVLLVPIGALLLIAALACITWELFCGDAGR